MKIVILIISLAFISIACSCQSPSVEWEQILGTPETDMSYSVCQTYDGGYIVAGQSYYGFWIVKLNSNGDTLWTKVLPGSPLYGDHILKQTTDSGYVVTGLIGSNFMLLKLNSQGDSLWLQSYGGSDVEESNSVWQTQDGGFILAGSCLSNDGDVTMNHGDKDYWLVKTDNDGNLEWQKSYGGSNADVAYSVMQTTDGGYILAGTSESNDGDVSVNQGYEDYWIVKTDSLGIIQWQKSMGGSYHDYASSVIQVTDSGYMVAGGSYSIDGDVWDHHNNNFSDCWVVKFSLAGDTLWTKSYGGSGGDVARSIQQTFDNGYIIAGSSDSDDGDVHPEYGYGALAYWILKISESGDTIWTKCLGGINSDFAQSVQQTSDGGYIITGSTSSYTIDSIYFDYWIVKLSPEPNDVNEIDFEHFFTVYPLPVRDRFTIEFPLESDQQEKVIILYDIYGKIFFREKCKTIGKTEVNVSGMTEGMYFISVLYKNKIYCRKFIIQK